MNKYYICTQSMPKSSFVAFSCLPWFLGDFVFQSGGISLLIWKKLFLMLTLSSLIAIIAQCILTHLHVSFHSSDYTIIQWVSVERHSPWMKIGPSLARSRDCREWQPPFLRVDFHSWLITHKIFREWSFMFDRLPCALMKHSEQIISQNFDNIYWILSDII